MCLSILQPSVSDPQLSQHFLSFLYLVVDVCRWRGRGGTLIIPAARYLLIMCVTLQQNKWFVLVRLIGFLASVL